MCAVSNIGDYGRDWWDKYPGRPIPQPWNPTPHFPTPNPKEEEARLKKFLEEFDKLRKQAEEFDRKTNQPSCEDPTKWDWYKELVARIEVLELALADKKIKKLSRKKIQKRITKERKKIRKLKNKS